MAFASSPLPTGKQKNALGSAVGAAKSKRTRYVQQCRPQRSRMRMSGEDLPTFKIANQASHNVWVDGYKNYLARSGEKACLMAMDGYEKLGRGAVFVVDRPNANVGIQTPAGVQDGIPSMYVPLAELERRDATVHSEIEPVVSRMRLYDPETQFVVVFEIQTETGGMQGADIVTPKQMPNRPQQTNDD